MAKLNRLPEGDAKRAAQAIDEAIKQSGDDPRLHAEALVLRAGIRKDPVERLADLNEAIRILPSDAAAFRARRPSTPTAASSTRPWPISTRPSSWTLSRHHLRGQGHAAGEDEEIRPGAGHVAKGPRNVARLRLPLVQRARIFGLQANMKAALAELDKAHEVEPSNLAVLLLRAAVLQELGEKVKALADIDRVLEIKPDLPEAIRLRIALLITDKKFDEAAAGLEKLRQQNPKDEDLLLQLGELYHMQKEIRQGRGNLLRRPGRQSRHVAVSPRPAATPNSTGATAPKPSPTSTRRSAPAQRRRHPQQPSLGAGHRPGGEAPRRQAGPALGHRGQPS